MNKVLNILGIDKVAARRLYEPKNISVIGLLIALYVILEKFAFYPMDWLKVNFGFLALMAIGMLFGPAAAMFAAIPCDIFGCLAVGKVLDFRFTPLAMLEAFIYGIIIYDRGQRNYAKTFGLRLSISRLIVIIVCYMWLNTALLYNMGLLSRGDGFMFQFWTRAFKNFVEYFADVVLMPFILLPINLAYTRFFGANPLKNKV